MSHAVIHNGVAYFCGQVARELVPDVQLQTETTLENIDKLLSLVETGRENILSATVYLKNIADFAAMNEIWDAWIPEGHAPARACVETRMAHDDIPVSYTHLTLPTKRIV